VDRLTPGRSNSHFSGDRYLPFEGAGAVGGWRLELPPKSLRTFDHGSISDAILTMRYTSLEGGASLRTETVKSVEDYAKQVSDASDSGSLSALFDVKNEFASVWSQWVGGDSEGTLGLAGLRDRLPMFAVGRAPGSVQAAQIYLLVDGVLPKGEIEVGAGGTSGEAVDHESCKSGWRTSRAWQGTLRQRARSPSQDMGRSNFLQDQLT
jgi:hypothetical protein